MNFERLNSGEQTPSADDSPWGESYQKGLPPFNPDQQHEPAEDQQSGWNLDQWYKRVQAGKAELHQSKLEAELRRPINTEVLLSEGDEELVRLARAIDNTTFAIPGQEEAADKRLEQAERNYQLAKERRDAEREVLEWAQDDDIHRYSQEELIARLDDFQYGRFGARSVDDVKERVRLGQACSRLRGRLEKFVPDAAGDLSDEDWEYWNKITGVAKEVSPEDLVPKTLPKDELVRLLGKSVEARETARGVIDEPLPAEDEGAQIEDIATGKTKEQLEADKANATVHIDEDFRRRMQEYNENLKRQQEQKQREENERVQQERQEAEMERKRKIQEDREKVLHAMRETTSKQLPEDASQDERRPMSYHFEAGLASDEATITVGQEIPDDWLEAGTTKNLTKGGFGIILERSPKIDELLTQALNIEFSKLSEEERRQHDYAALAKMIKEEARKTKRIPDIAAIIKTNNQELEQENEIEM